MGNYPVRRVAYGYATRLPDMDFETYSEAGFLWDEQAERWVSLLGKGKTGGLSVVGQTVYAQHPSTEVLSLAYDLKNGTGKRMWLPGMPPPQELFDHLERGGLIEAHNAAFEYAIWKYVCHERMGWPMIDYLQMRDSMAKARAWSLPGALGKAAEVLGTDIQKDKEGTRLIKKFCIPRNPTKKDDRLRHHISEFPEDAVKFIQYNLTDIESESDLSIHMPDLRPDDMEFWLNTQACNYRGVGVRRTEVEACITILEQAYAKYNSELAVLTQGAVLEATKVRDMQAWLASRGLNMGESIDDSAILSALKLPVPPDVRRVLEIRRMIGSAGVKKVYAMQRQADRDGRLCNLFNFNGARTGRDTGSDVQPQNLVKVGPRVAWCPECGKPHRTDTDICPNCAHRHAAPAEEWSVEAVDPALDAMKSGSLEHVEHIFGDAVLTISGCIRGLFVAAPGREFICSDYSAIEAVVTAALAGEEWRLEAFRQKRDIYLMSASQITGTSYDEYIRYAKEHGQKHPDRQKIGKVAELALGFMGGLGAWRNFDSSDTFTDDEVKQKIMQWREASQKIVEFAGGQTRGKPWAPDRYELYGLEGMAIAAIQNPGQEYWVNGVVSYQVIDDVLYARLPSGRRIAYHRPRVAPSGRFDNPNLLEISYEGYNTNPKYGKIGWIRIDTYAGKLIENAVQAIANDILRFANNNLERAAYPVVLRVHDELVAEVPEGFGSVEEFEAIMGTLPEWAKDWPVRASGGWRGLRYRKD